MAPRRRCRPSVRCCHVVMYTCLLVTPALKSALPALCRVVSVCRFAHPHSLIAWCTRFLAGKKKDSRMSHFLPLCVQHSKGFPPGIVQARLESGKSAESLRY